MDGCVVRSFASGFCGALSPAEDEIHLDIDHSTVHAGSVISGTVQVVGDYAHEVTADVVLEGIEYCIVALPQHQLDEYGNMGIDYLKKHTTESDIFLESELTLRDAEHPTHFRFKLPDSIPGTLRCILDGTDPQLPSQCQIKYKVTATIRNREKSSKRQVSHPIIVLPKKETNIPLDPGLQVSSTGSALDVLYRSLFLCGGGENDIISCSTSYSCGSQPTMPDLQISQSCSSDNILEMDDDDDKDDEIDDFAYSMKMMTAKPHVPLESSHDKLYLSAGQAIEVTVRDFFRQLPSGGNWMIRFMEELSWKSQGRKAKSHQSWDLYANSHELPTTLRRSFVGSLVKVRHQLMVYLTNKDSSREIIALTEPIPVLIVSDRRGWAA